MKSVMMDKKLSADLVESMTEMGEIVRGERAPSREFHADASRAETQMGAIEQNT